MPGRTLFDRIWDEHVVRETPDGTVWLHVDRHYLHEATSAQAFAGLRQAGRRVWRAASCLAVADHSVPTRHRRLDADDVDTFARRQVEALDRHGAEYCVPVYGLRDPRQGIVHVVGPEQGATLPGATVVCGDSHTSTHGAFGAIAQGIGTSDVEHVLATQTLVTRKPRRLRVRFHGRLSPGVTAKDMALAMIGALGTAGATGHAIEYAGEAVQALSMEGRMTLCNLSIEAGARCGLVAVDDTTLDYLHGRPFAPRGTRWDAAEAHWRTLRSDPDAAFDREVDLHVRDLAPQVTWGTSPEMVAAIDGCVPDPDTQPDPVRRAGMRRALDYMGLVPGTRLADIAIDRVFIGSCTNARLEDLRAAAAVVRGRHLAPRIRQALVVPGSEQVRRQAEAEGLHQVFMAAGFEWRHAGCSMCVGMNGDSLAPGERCAATSNRNFEDRQGPGGRTHLVSPAMAAAAAIAGHFVDVRQWLA
jgi:3-isopropylmalate/(R)-2-methylmalate dehydratase large subunit